MIILLTIGGTAFFVLGIRIAVVLGGINSNLYAIASLMLKQENRNR